MKRSRSLLFVLLAALCPVGQLETVHAAIVTTGDVDPELPWSSSTTGYVGKTADGSLTVDSDSDLYSFVGYIGYDPGSTGEVTVDGTGSTWTARRLYVGDYGSGTLNVTNGGLVRESTTTLQVLIGNYSDSRGVATVDGTGSMLIINGDSYVGREGTGTLNIADGGVVRNTGGADTIVSIGHSFGSVGEVTVDGTGSTWTGGLPYVGYEGNGTLNITDGGAVRGGRYVGYSAGSTGVVSVDGAGSTWTTNIRLGVGYDGSGTLNVTNGGAVVTSYDGEIGEHLGSTGEVTVDGTGSTWTITGHHLFVGYGGTGTLNITRGGAVSNPYGIIGSTGVVTVDGTGSTWTMSSGLGLGVGPGGTLNIADGGAVTATSVSTNTNSHSLLAIEVSNDSMLTVDNGSGTITNDGTVRIVGGAGLEPGTTYTPISAGTWTGTGSYEALGGTWDEINHVFTVSDVEQGTPGAQLIIDLLSKQRVMIDDAETGWSVGASFLATPSSTLLGLEASPIAGDQRAGLEDLLGPGESVLGGWQFTATGGYSPGDPAYLSFDVGAGYARKDLLLWHYDGVDWDEYAATDLTYDGASASFTVTGLSGYAVTVVPEPATITLLLLGLGTMALLARPAMRGWNRKRGEN